MVRMTLFARVISTSLLFAMCAPTLGVAQGAAPSFSASISTPRTTLVSGSEVCVDITLKSESNDLVLVEEPRNGPRGAGIKIWDAAGNLVEALERFKDRPDTVRRIPGMAIEPGKSVKDRVIVSNWFDLTKPGQYVLQLRKRDPLRETFVESNKLTITITPKQL